MGGGVMATFSVEYDGGDPKEVRVPDEAFEKASQEDVVRHVLGRFFGGTYAMKYVSLELDGEGGEYSGEYDGRHFYFRDTSEWES
jgi:hypothetical protein